MTAPTSSPAWVPYDGGICYVWAYNANDLDGYGTFAVPAGTVVDLTSSALQGRDVQAFISRPDGSDVLVYTPSYMAANGRSPDGVFTFSTFTVPADGWSVSLSDWGAFDPATGRDIAPTAAVSWTPDGSVVPASSSTQLDTTAMVGHALESVGSGVDAVGGPALLLAGVLLAVVVAWKGVRSWVRP